MNTLFQHPFLLKKSWLIIACTMGLQIPMASAVDYGTYDARALAMGGTGVAIGDTSQAVYYNPALLAFHDGDKDKTQDGRVYLPTLTAQASTAIDSAISAVNDHIDTKLSQALNAFNAQSNTVNAGLVASSARDLRKVLDQVANKDLTVDAFAGVSVSEPSDREGGAFYVGVRTIGVATSKVPKEDVALLDEYIDAMSQIADGVSPILVAILHPNLIGANGQFSDPTTKFTSSADVSALLIGEWGVALAKEFTPWGQQPIEVGFTPKLMRIDAYRDSINFNNNRVNSLNAGLNQFSDSKTSLTTFNADLGLATLLDDHYRISLAVKDLIGRNFNTKQVTGPDLTVKLRPRSRIGMAYVSDELSLGVDYDLQESTPIAKESANQELGLGAEYKPFGALALRVGYRHDLASTAANIFSGGIGYQGKRFVADIAYSQSSDSKGASLQMGWTF